MAISALVLQVLISGPGDLPGEHRDTVHSALRGWNAAYGKIFGVVFNPVDWKESASPGVGEYGQGVLNEQIVDESDMAIVLLTDRMGTPTPGHPSGTAEEVDRMLNASKEVAVYTNDCPRTLDRSKEAQLQREALGEFVNLVQERAYTGSYTTTEELRISLSVLLPRVAKKFRSEVDAALVTSQDDEDEPRLPIDSTTVSAPDPSEGVWPRLEVTESTDTNSRGQLHTKRRWRLVLESTVPRPVHNVRYRYEDRDGTALEAFSLREDRNEPVETLAPRGSVQFPVLRVLGSPSQAICVVDWEDSNVARTTRATVRAA